MLTFAGSWTTEAMVFGDADKANHDVGWALHREFPIILARLKSCGSAACSLDLKQPIPLRRSDVALHREVPVSSRFVRVGRCAAKTRSGIRAHRQFEVGRWDDDELFAFVAAVRMTFIGQIHSMRSEPPHTWLRVSICCSMKRRVHDLRPIRGFSSRRATPINSLSVRGPSRR